MRRTIVPAVVLLLCAASVASAADINLRVTTDKLVYDPGEMVQWTMYAWADNTIDNGVAGVSFLALNLLEDQGETLNLPEITIIEFMGIEFKELTDSEYDLANKFVLQSRGNASSAGLLADIIVRQNDDDRLLGVGVDGDNGTIFAIGEFEATIVGLHTLSMSINGANYWPNGSDAAVAFNEGLNQTAGFEVVPEPATLALVGLGMSALAYLRRRRRR